MNRNATRHFLVERGHGDDLNAAILGVQNALKGNSAHYAHDADDHIRYVLVLDHPQHVFTVSKDSESFNGLVNFFPVIVNESDQQERWGIHRMVQPGKGASRLAGTDDQDAALET